MKELNKTNEKPVASASVKVSAENCASAVKSGSLPVFSTPMMLALMEEATCLAAAQLLDDGETTVGTAVRLTHSRPSKIGETITALARLNSTDGRRLVFGVTAEDESGREIGSAVIERVAVDSDKFMKKVNG